MRPTDFAPGRVLPRFCSLLACLLLWAGAGWAAYCSGCGASLPQRARFCPMCGKRVPASVNPGRNAAPPAGSRVERAKTGSAAVFYPDGRGPRASDDYGPPDREPTAGGSSTAMPESAAADPTAERPVFDAAAATPGTLKVGSTPIDCVVTFRGHGYEKNKGVLVFEEVPPGTYTITFSRAGKVLQKSVDIHAGRTAFVYGNLQRARPRTTQSPAGFAAAPATKPATVTRPENLVPSHPLPAPARGRSVPDADDKFLLAETLRKAVNPFNKKSRYRRAEKLYLEILRRWPDCDKVEQCHYRLGQIYESIYRCKYRRAIERYLEVLRINPRTEFHARWRIAALYRNRLGEKVAARKWYEQAAALSPDEGLRKQAAKLAAMLREQGF